MSLSDRERAKGFQRCVRTAVAVPNAASERVEGFQRAMLVAVAVAVAVTVAIAVEMAVPVTPKERTH